TASDSGRRRATGQAPKSQVADANRRAGRTLQTSDQRPGPERAANLSGLDLNGSAQVNGDTAREHRVVQFCLHRFQPRGHVECQLSVYRVARVDVVEKHTVRPAGAVEVYVRARACVVFPAAGIVNILA